MFIHPSIHLEISRQRQRDLLAESERHRFTKDALAITREDRRRPPRETPSPTAVPGRPQRAST
jgi:hypothetical protein